MEKKIAEVILGLGSNVGRKKDNFDQAIRLIESADIKVVSKSKIYETPPWGFSAAENFYNMAVKVETKLSPFQLLIEVKAVELKMGRPFKVSQDYLSRIIDIDIIDFDHIYFKNSDLEIPHPLLSVRDFVLYPLKDVCFNYRHPIMNKTVDELIAALEDNNATLVNISA